MAPSLLKAATSRLGSSKLVDGRPHALASVSDRLDIGSKQSLILGSQPPPTRTPSRAGTTTCGLSSSLGKTPTSRWPGNKQLAPREAQKVAGRRSHFCNFVEAVKGQDFNFGPQAPVPADGGAARSGFITVLSLKRYGAAGRDFFDGTVCTEDQRQASESMIDQQMCRYFDVSSGHQASSRGPLCA